MKRTILSEKESLLIESLIAEYGVVVTFKQIYRVLKGKILTQSIKNLVNKLMRNGWLVRIKKGTYAIATLESRGFASIPTFKIAQILLKDSYVSFEAALQHHGMFDQQLKTVVSVARKRYPLKEIQGVRYKFILTKKRQFYGWQEERVENYVVRVATAEKALLDMLCFQRNLYSIDLVAEKLKNYKDSFDLDRLHEMCRKQSMTVRRILGFLLDKLAIDSGSIHRLISGAKDSSYMTKDSKKFDAKWRLYYHHRLKS
jgi:predicted transcriptional regulator of viral defense system